MRLVANPATSDSALISSIAVRLLAVRGSSRRPVVPDVPVVPVVCDGVVLERGACVSACAVGAALRLGWAVCDGIDSLCALVGAFSSLILPLSSTRPTCALRIASIRCDSDADEFELSAVDSTGFLLAFAIII